MYPIYLPEKHLYIQKLVHHEHLNTLHEGVGLTMTSVRSPHWVPCLRSWLSELSVHAMVVRGSRPRAEQTYHLVIFLGI